MIPFSKKCRITCRKNQIIFDKVRAFGWRILLLQVKMAAFKYDASLTPSMFEKLAHSSQNNEVITIMITNLKV